jgi:hypothetical protein
MTSGKILIITAIVLLLGAVGYLFIRYQGPGRLQETETDASEQPAVTGAYVIFDGDDGYLLKGKLLDEKYRKEYDRFPDTLALLSFGDRLFNLDGEAPTATPAEAVAQAATAATVAVAPPATYRLFDSSTTASNAEERRKYVNYKFVKLFDYLLLADAGKAAYPTLVANDGGTAMYDFEFDKTYSAFKPLYSKDIPHRLKEKLVEFFATEQGAEFGFPDNGLRDASELLVFGTFTGGQREDMACVLTTKDEYASTKKNCLLVYSHNVNNGEPYCLYNEVYYDNVVISKIGKGDMIYINTDELVPAPSEGIMVRTAENEKVVLLFNEQFGKIKRYLQVPSSGDSSPEYDG